MSLTGCRPALTLVVVLTCGAAGTTQQVGTAVLRGAILSADGGAPIAQAKVMLLSPMLAEPRVAIAGPDGVYEFRALPAGPYNVAVTHAGYAERRYDEPSIGDGKLLRLADGERRTGISITLARAGVIAGTLLNAEGKPLAAGTVEALASRTELGRPTLVRGPRAQTDDRGEFMVAGLAPGKYYLCAVDRAAAGASQAVTTPPAPTCYPGVSLADQPRPIDVSAGAGPAEKIVFSLKVFRSARVSGTIRTQDRKQLLSGAVIMSPLRDQNPLIVSPQDVRILPDGSFVFRSVPPGRYQIRGRGEVEGQPTALFATYAVTVQGADLENIDMVLLPGTGVAGALIVDGPGKPASFSGVRVRAPFLDGSNFGDSLTGDVRPDGAFRVRGVMSGRHVFRVEGLPHPWLMTSVVYRGADITDQGFDAVSTEPVNDVRITIANASAEVSGIVRDATGTPATDAIVVIVPVSEQFWTRMSRHIGIARSDAGGRYQMRGLPAGEYRAVASPDLDAEDVYRRTVLQDVSALGRPLTLSRRESRVLDLSTSSAAVVRPFFAR